MSKSSTNRGVESHCSTNRTLDYGITTSRGGWKREKPRQATLLYNPYMEVSWKWGYPKWMENPIRPEKLFHLQNQPPVILQKRRYGWMHRNGNISKIPKYTCEGKVLSRISFPGKSDCFGLGKWKSPSVRHDTSCFKENNCSLGMDQTWAKHDKTIMISIN